MLRGIPSVLSPEMLMVLAEMGHGDTIAIGDMHYPAASTATNILLRADGIGSAELIDAILKVFPLDPQTEKPFLMMEVQACDADKDFPIQEEYYKLAAKYDPRGRDAAGTIERFAFYAAAKKAYAVIATGEKSFYGCTILTKGLVMPEDVI